MSKDFIKAIVRRNENKKHVLECRLRKLVRSKSMDTLEWKVLQQELKTRVHEGNNLYKRYYL